MKRPHLKILILSIILGSFFRLYKLNTNYVWFNDTFFRLTPALEILKGVPVKFDSSMLGATGIGVCCFSISRDLYSVVLAVCITGILCIPLSYYFVLKLSGDQRISALTSLFVSVNPTLVALSKVLIWDIFVLFFFLISGIVFLSLKEKQGVLKGVILSVMLFLLFSFKLPNVLFAVIVYFFLFYSRKFSIKNSKDIIVSLLGYLTLLGIFFYHFPNTLNFFISGGGENFFLKEDYFSIFVATVKLLISPVASPQTSMAFPSGVSINIFFLIGLISFLPVIIYLKNIGKIDDLFPIATVLAVSIFYLNFSGWSHRYLAVPLFLMLFFVSYGIIKIKERSGILSLALAGICILASLGPSSLMAEDWNSNASLALNHIATPLSLFDEAAGIIEAEKVDLIASSYGRVFTFYALSGKLNTTVLDFYALDETSVESEIRGALSSGKRVSYIEGWPDVYIFEGKDTRSYKEMIQSSFLLKTYYTSREQIYLEDGEYPSIIIYDVQKK